MDLDLDLDLDRDETVALPEAVGYDLKLGGT